MAPPEHDAPALTPRTPRIVAAAKLHRGAARRKAGRFLAEGPNSVSAAIAAGAAVELYVAAAAAARHPGILSAAAAAGVRAHPIDDAAAAKLADTVTSTGLFALCAADAALAEPGEVLAAAAAGGTGPGGIALIGVDTADPGNAGTLIRMADALGAAGVVLAGDCVDPLGGKVVRSTAGSLFHVPVARHRDIGAVLDAAAAAGVATLATAADAELALGADPLPAGPVAWLLGNEAHGLDPATRARADARVRIPIRGRAESLNLATAAAMCLWESARSRGAEPTHYA